MGVSITSCRLWHLLQTAFSDSPSRASSGEGAAIPAAHDTANTTTTHLLIATLSIHHIHSCERNRCAPRQRSYMRTHAQLLRCLVVPETICKLIRDPLRVAIIERNIQQLFAVHRVAVLVLHLADNLVRLHVDDVARRSVRVFAIQAERHPERARRSIDGVDFLRVIRIRENMDLLEDPIRKPYFFSV